MLDKKNNTWDRSFTEKKDKYGKRMQPKLLRVAGAVENGHVLDIGIGEGRNSLFFAQQGFKVLGLDISQIALNRVAEVVKEQNLDMELKQENILDSKLEKGKYQLIIAS